MSVEDDVAVTCHDCVLECVMNVFCGKRPFLSYLVPLFQDESSCKTSHRKMSLICMKMNL